MAEETRIGCGRKYDQSILYPDIKCYNETIIVHNKYIPTNTVKMFTK